MKLRALHSFLISLNAHVWLVVLLSAVLVSEQKPPEPRRIEVQLLKLPAPLEGSSIDPSGSSRADTAARASPGEARQAGVRPREPVRRRRGPRVEYRVRVARTTAPVAGRESGTWVPASRVRFRESAVQDTGTRIAGVSPDARPTADSRPTAPAGDSTSDDQWPFNPVDDSVPDDAGGDTRELIEIIQARIDAVTPLVHASAGPCQTMRGIVHLRFIVNRAGYPGGFRIIASSGVRCLDAEVSNVLHMAEPYPFVAGWIPVTVRFAPRTNI